MIISSKSQSVKLLSGVNTVASTTSLEDQYLEEVKEQLLANMRGEPVSAAVAAAAAAATAAATAAAAAGARSGKKPMRALTVDEKVTAIDRVHDGESKASVARDIGVPESTLRGWCKSEDKIRQQAAAQAASATPNSEAARSPASSSSENNEAIISIAKKPARRKSPKSSGRNSSSEDEGGSSRPGGIKRKRRSVEPQQEPSDLTTNGYRPSTTNEYYNMLNNIIAASAVNTASGSLLCQPMNLFSTSSSTSKQPQQQQQQQQQQLSFVENGLQYSIKSNKRASMSSAVAPTSHVDSVSKSGATRRSLPPAAEAPHTSHPLSPRRGDTISVHQQQRHYYNQMGTSSSSGAGASSGSSGASTSSYMNHTADPSVQAWLDNQQKVADPNPTYAVANNTLENFWEVCKTYGCAAVFAACTGLVNRNIAMNAASFETQAAAEALIAAANAHSTSTSGSAIASTSASTVPSYSTVAFPSTSASASTSAVAFPSTSTSASTSAVAMPSTSRSASASTSASTTTSPADSSTRKLKKFRHSICTPLDIARANVEEALCANNNNNNETARRSLNPISMDDGLQQQEQPSTSKTEDKVEASIDMSFEQAMAHAYVFNKWLEEYVDPANSLTQIMQFKSMLGKLEQRRDQLINGDHSIRKSKKIEKPVNYKR